MSSEPEVSETENSQSPDHDNATSEIPTVATELQPPTRQKRAATMDRNDQDSMPGSTEAEAAMLKSRFEVDDDEGLPGIVYKPTTLEGIRQGTVIEQLQELYSSSGNVLHFLHNLYHYVVGALTDARVFWLAFVGVIAALALAMLTMGLVFVNMCPAEPCIPVFNIVGGCAVLLTIVIRICEQQARHKRKLTRPTSNPRAVDSFLGRMLVLGVFSKVLIVFLICWFLAGCVWIYGSSSKIQYDERITEPDLGVVTTATPETSTLISTPIVASWCSWQLYEFSVWLISILLLLTLLLLIAIIVLVFVLSNRKRS